MFSFVGRPGLPKQRRWITKPNHHPEQCSRERARRINQLAEGKLSFQEVRVTPRREGDFTGKAWRYLNARTTAK